MDRRRPALSFKKLKKSILFHSILFLSSAPCPSLMNREYPGFGPWKCTSCGVENQESNAHCSICGNGKPQKMWKCSCKYVFRNLSPLLFLFVFLHFIALEILIPCPVVPCVELTNLIPMPLWFFPAPFLRTSLLAFNFSPFHSSQLLG